MKFRKPFSLSIIGAFCLLLPGSPAASAQNPQLQERLGEIKQAAVQNKQALAHYTWQENQTISIKGQVRKEKVFGVQLGPNGKPQKTEISETPQSAGEQYGLKQRIIEKKKEEFEEYARQIAELAQSYAQPEPGKLQQLFQKGDITLAPAGTPGVVQLVIHNYLKPNDEVTLVFSSPEKALLSIQVNSYLNDPQDAVTVSAQFDRIPGGPNYVSSMEVNGVTKQLTVSIKNTNYRKM